MAETRTIRTPEEIQSLKDAWVRDPCWDIEDTEGFEAHRQELELFHQVMDTDWAAAIQRSLEAKAYELGVPGNLKLAEYVMRLERRLMALEAQGI